MEQDHRRVQTAVMGAPDSDEPAYIPLDQDLAEAFREAHRGSTTFWCGTLLGGCGGPLSVKVYRARRAVPHFAHQGPSHLCGRRALGADSADHLYTARQLHAWACEHAGAQPLPRYLHPGQANTQLLLPGTGEHLTPVRVVFTAAHSPDLNTLAASAEGAATQWLVRENPTLVSTLLRHKVPFHLFRLRPRELTRVVELRRVAATGEVHWVPLDEVALVRGRLAPRPRPAPCVQTTAPAPEGDVPGGEARSGLEASLRALEHFLGQGSHKDIKDFSDRLRRHLNDPRERARLLLEQSAALLGPPATDAPQAGTDRWRQQVQQRARARPRRDQHERDRELRHRRERVEGELRRVQGLQEEVRKLAKQLRAAWKDSDWESYNRLRHQLVGIERRDTAPQRVRSQVQNVLRDAPYVGPAREPSSSTWSRRRRGPQA